MGGTPESGRSPEIAKQRVNPVSHLDLEWGSQAKECLFLAIRQSPQGGHRLGLHYSAILGDQGQVVNLGRRGDYPVKRISVWECD